MNRLKLNLAKKGILLVENMGDWGVGITTSLNGSAFSWKAKVYCLGVFRVGPMIALGSPGVSSDQ